MQIKAAQARAQTTTSNADMGPGPGLVISPPFTSQNENMAMEVERRSAESSEWAAIYNAAPEPN